MRWPPPQTVEQLHQRPVLPAAASRPRPRHQHGGKACRRPLRMRTSSRWSARLQDLCRGAQQGVDMPIGDLVPATVAHVEARPSVRWPMRVSNCCTAGQPAFCTAEAIPTRNFKPSQRRRIGFGRFRDQLEGVRGSAAGTWHPPPSARSSGPCAGTARCRARLPAPGHAGLSRAAGVTHSIVGGAGEAHVAGGGLEGTQAAEWRKAVAHGAASIARRPCGASTSSAGPRRPEGLVLSRAGAAPIAPAVNTGELND